MQCCTEGQCVGDSGSCFCDIDCHLYGDCCDDIEDIICPLQQGRSDSDYSLLLHVQTIFVQLL